MAVALVYFALLAVAFYFLLIRPQQRRVAAQRALMAHLELGDEVITTAGIYGVVRRLDDVAVALEVAPGTVIKVARAAIAQRVPDEPDEPDELDDPDA